MSHSPAEIWRYERDHGKPETLAQAVHYADAHAPMPPSRAHLKRLARKGEGFVPPPITPTMPAPNSGRKFYYDLIREMGKCSPCVEVITAKTGNIPDFHTTMWDIVDANGKHVRRGIVNRLDAGNQARKLVGTHYVVQA